MIQGFWCAIFCIALMGCEGEKNSRTKASGSCKGTFNDLVGVNTEVCYEIVDSVENATGDFKKDCETTTSDGFMDHIAGIWLDGGKCDALNATAKCYYTHELGKFSFYVYNSDANQAVKDYLCQPGEQFATATYTEEVEAELVDYSCLYESSVNGGDFTMCLDYTGHTVSRKTQDKASCENGLSLDGMPSFSDSKCSVSFGTEGCSQVTTAGGTEITWLVGEAWSQGSNNSNNICSGKTAITKS
jgi:hypothetical protein